MRRRAMRNLDENTMNTPDNSALYAQLSAIEAGNLEQNLVTPEPAPDEIEQQLKSASILAELDINKIDDGRIMGMLRCTMDDLNQVRMSEYYKERFAQFTYDIEKATISTEEQWRQIELIATQNLHSGLINDPMNVDLSLKAAAIANRNRKASMKDAGNAGGNNSQTGTTNNTNVLVLQLSPRVAEIMGTMRSMTPDMPQKITGMISMAELNERLSLAADPLINSEQNLNVDNMPLT
jgi:hypothetical protein